MPPRSASVACAPDRENPLLAPHMRTCRVTPSHLSSASRCRALVIAALALSLSGCATAPAGRIDAAPRSPAASGTAAAAAPRPRRDPRPRPMRRLRSRGQPRAFAEVIKDAKEMRGLFQGVAEGREDLAGDRPGPVRQALFLLGQPEPRPRREVGAGRHARGQRRGRPSAGWGRRCSSSRASLRYFAKPSTPEARAVEEAFADSLLASAPVVSQPHPDRKSVLVEATALFFADIPARRRLLERRSASRTRSTHATRRSAGAGDGPTRSFSVSAHYALATVSVPSGAARPYRRSHRRRCPTDLRSLFLGVHYSFARLPETPMRPRLADDRIGHFGTTLLDFTTTTARMPIVHYVNRWRLEKKDPAAALSEPKQPIVYWIDRTVPAKYHAADPRRRAGVEQGVREDRLQGRDPRRDPARRRENSTRRTSATPRSAG